MTDNEKRFIQGIFSGDSSGHDYYHTIRVYKLATKIAKQENADVKIVQLAALLHILFWLTDFLLLICCHKIYIILILEIP